MRTIAQMKPSKKQREIEARKAADPIAQVIGRDDIDYSTDELPTAPRVLDVKVPDFGFAGFTRDVHQPNDVPACKDGREHCWHTLLVQHAMLNHRDEGCCWCGNRQCVSLPDQQPEGHGPFHQGR